MKSVDYYRTSQVLQYALIVTRDYLKFMDAHGTDTMGIESLPPYHLIAAALRRAESDGVKLASELRDFGMKAIQTLTKPEEGKA